MSRRPDIIIINPDEMRADALAHLGNPAAVTPHLDAFQETEAVSFRNAFCQNPVCVPSRCSFTTGLYPHVYGHRTMQYLLREGETSIFSELKDAGYNVWMNARNDLIAGQIDGLIEKHTTEIFYGGDAPKAPGPITPNARGQMGDKNFYSFYRGELGLDENNRNYSSDDEDVDAAAAKILSQDPEQPLCLFLGLSAPHCPYQIEEPYFSAINRDKLLRRAKVLPDAEKARIAELLRQNMKGLELYTEEDWDELRAVYLGMCMKVDEQFQKVLDALKAAGRYENSAIFFFSDHGDYTGDYDLPEKCQNDFPDCLVKVPFLVKPPKGVKVSPGISDSLVELVDFYATALDYAGVKPSHTHFGINLNPVLADRAVSIRDYAFCEGGRMPNEVCSEYVNAHCNGENPSLEYWPRQKAMSDNEGHYKGTMISDSHYKLVYRSNGKSEFYDLEKDSLEEKNVISDQQYAEKVAKMQLAMLAWYQNTCDIVPFDFDSRFNKKMLWSKVKRNVPKGHEAEVQKLIQEGMEFQYVLAYVAGLNKE